MMPSTMASSSSISSAINDHHQYHYQNYFLISADADDDADADDADAELIYDVDDIIIIDGYCYQSRNRRLCRRR